MITVSGNHTLRLRTAFALRWIARIGSLLSAFCVVAAAIGGNGGMPTINEAVGLLLFPIGVLAGFAIAWWCEGLGGAVTIGSVIAFYVWHGGVQGRMPSGPYFAILAAPGLLFLLGYLVDRSKSTVN
jgi:hypothetical protein